MPLPPSFAHVAETHRIIFDTELSCYHRQLFSEKKDQYPPNLRVRIESGLQVPGHRYVETVRRRGFPAISLPSGLDGGGLPYGVQLAGSAGAEDNLAEAASWCEAVLAFGHRPEE